MLVSAARDYLLPRANTIRYTQPPRKEGDMTATNDPSTSMKRAVETKTSLEAGRRYKLRGTVYDADFHLQTQRWLLIPLEGGAILGLEDDGTFVELQSITYDVVGSTGFAVQDIKLLPKKSSKTAGTGCYLLALPVVYVLASIAFAVGVFAVFLVWGAEPGRNNQMIAGVIEGFAGMVVITFGAVCGFPGIVIFFGVLALLKRGQPGTYKELLVGILVVSMVMFVLGWLLAVSNLS